MEDNGYIRIPDEALTESLLTFDFDVMDSFGAIEAKKKFLDECISGRSSRDAINQVTADMDEKDRRLFGELFKNCVRLAFDICASIELLISREKRAAVIKLVSSFMILDKEKLKLLKQICEKASQIEIITVGVKNLDLELVISFFQKN